ncbi:protein lethal(3)malignant blood neoplasm 1-like [Pieris brassicae]|uniref:protein lethal(3)malignant blood neoplasm 1-like n=1 Tax=Pieris brassicae TaxID=7116 RepID=UPI001E65E3AB|nr:protein lethal(3)malignant blood neoplasm 1-like [Pieris brassicae]XP_045513630.1 protein lethal(3)malignant blood neoplasm 1-like [Pieris brassicae]
MVFAKVLITLSIITVLSRNVNGVDKYTDENRPYEFGFTIDGEQHRHEKKDENGIIMGEFGFITADGVYHVTVYATDENGAFKILSMKNIRVKPYPGTTSQNSRTGHSLALTSTSKTPSSPIETNAAPYKNTPLLRTSLTSSIESNNHPNIENSPKPSLQIVKQPAAPVQACSHCSLPTTTTVALRIDPPTINQQNPYNSQANQEGKIDNSLVEKKYNQFTNKATQNYEPQSAHEPQTNVLNSYQGSSQATPEVSNQGLNRRAELPQRALTTPNNPGQQNYNQGTSYENAQGDNRSQNIGPNNNYDNTDQVPNNPSINLLRSGFNTQNPEISVPNSEIELPLGNSYQGIPQNYAQSQSVSNSPSQSITSERNPKSYEPNIGVPQSNVGGVNLNEYDTTNLEPPKSPKLLSAQMQIVDKNTDIYHKNPGEKDGLPEGVTKDYMMGVLYVFNYTIGFHGHYEKGFADGSKEGYYYVTGRNGVRTRVDYEADEKGFRPKITEEVLDLISDEVPKPETEKEPRYGLKSYEFKWLYFPVGS